MSGTILCGVSDPADVREAAQLAAALGERLGLRLVLAHAVDGFPAGGEDSLTARQRQAGGERALTAIIRELGVRDRAAQRVVFGNRAEVLATIAAEEGADLIVLGSRPRGLGGRHLRCTLARELEAVTPVPVLIAPPQTRVRGVQRLAADTGAGALRS